MSDIKTIFFFFFFIIAVLAVGLFHNVLVFREKKRVTNRDLALLSKYILFPAFVGSTFLIEYTLYEDNTQFVSANLFVFMLVTKSILFVFTVVAVLHSSDFGFWDKDL